MKTTESKNLYLVICGMGCLIILLGILFSPSFVANHVSSDGVLEESKVNGLQILRLLSVCLGMLAILCAILAQRYPTMFPRVLGLLDSRAIVPVLFLISFCYLLSGNRTGLNMYDEGITVYGADRVLNGEVPYRDFWTIYAPAQFYTLAFLFKVFGPSIEVERTYSAIVDFMIVVLAYRLARKLVPQRLALLSWLVSTLWIGSFRSYGYPIPPSLVFSLLSCVCLANFISKKRNLNLLLAGIFMGIAALFRHDIGFYLLVSETAVIITFAYVNISISTKRQTRKSLVILQTWSKYLAGAAIVILPVAAFFIHNVPIRELFADLVIFPATTLPEFRSLPYPAPIPNPMHVISGDQTIFHYAEESLGRLPFYFPLVVFTLTFVIIIIGMRRRRHQSDKAWISTLLLLLGITFLNQVRSRSDSIHLLPAIVPAMILFPLLFSWLVQTDSIKSHLSLRISIYSLGFLAILAISRPDSIMRSSEADLAPLNLARAQHICLPEDRAEHIRKSIRFIQQSVPKADKIFVGNSRHDKIPGSHIMFYFLAERHSGTKYHNLHPGLATTRQVQREIIEDLNRYGVRYVVLLDLDKGKDMRAEPNESAKSSGVTELDRFIESNYTEVKNFGDYRILKRASEMLPSKR